MPRAGFEPSVLLETYRGQCNWSYSYFYDFIQTTQQSLEPVC